MADVVYTKYVSVRVKSKDIVGSVVCHLWMMYAVHGNTRKYPGVDLRSCIPSMIPELV